MAKAKIFCKDNKKNSCIYIFFILHITHRQVVGVSPSGKASAFGADIRRFESCHPSHSSKIVRNGDFFFYIQAFKLVRMFDIKYAISRTIFELILSRR